MEWVEVRGETLEEAKEEALDQLGVDRSDAEFEIVQEAESRWMGLKKTEARVRARVRPTTPPPKKETGRNNRRSRGRRGGQGVDSARQGGGNGRQGARNSNRGGQQKGQKKGQQRQGQGQQSQRGDGPKGRSGTQNKRRREGAPQTDKAAESPDRTKDVATKKEAAVNDSGRSSELVPVEEQQQMVASFLEGLVESFGLEGSVSVELEEDILIGAIDGSDLGLLVGPRGGTLRAIQEISRSAVQRMSDGRDTNRLMVDVARYRERRRAALGEFAQRQAELVLDTGNEVVLEPMSSADRKAIHDAAMGIEGVKSVSRGDDPYRKVVLQPAD